MGLQKIKDENVKAFFCEFDGFFFSESVRGTLLLLTLKSLSI